MDADEIKRERSRLAIDPHLEHLLEEVNRQIMVEWLASPIEAREQREMLFHELRGATRVSAVLKAVQTDDLINEHRDAVDGQNEDEQNG